MLVLLVMAAAALTGAPPAPASTGAMARIENAAVVQVSPRPAAGSGVLAIYADFEVETETGARLRLYVPWMGGRQYLPDVGSVCTISYRREPLARGTLRNSPAGGGQAVGPFNVVYELSCGPPLREPASGQRSPSAL